MIFTVFAGAPSAGFEWQSELLAHSWLCARQPGELVRLVASHPDKVVAAHPRMRDLATMSWSPHPYTNDVYPSYQTAASVLELLFVEPIEGTVLLVEPTTVFQGMISEEVRTGEARGTGWADLPRGEGPFGLGPAFAFLESFCVDRTLELTAVKLPVLIHTGDLRKIAARWLELTSIIRAETANRPGGALPDADKIAYAIAAAEAHVPHKIASPPLAIDAQADASAGTGPLIEYRGPLRAADRHIIWEKDSHRRGDAPDPEAAPPGPARHLLGLLADIAALRAQGIDGMKPRRESGVREGKILGTLFLEIPGRPDTISLNSSGASIWEVCDGTRSLAEINRQLERRFDMPAGSLKDDIEVVVKRLEGVGALRLESA